MKVYLPSRFDNDTMYGFLDQVLDENVNPRAEEFDFDFTSLSFIQPPGVTILSNIVRKLRKHDVTVSFTYYLPNRSKKFCPIKFLDDSMFFKHFFGKKLDEKASLRVTTLPLENVTYDRSYGYLEGAMSWLAPKLSLTKESLGDIKVCIEEVFNNINDHSSDNTGSIFIQHYPKEKKVMVSISDIGIGIPGSIQSHFPNMNDAEALRAAIRQGFTTKSTPRNRGAGLDILLHNVVINNHGSVYIHSNNGILSAKYMSGVMDVNSEMIEGFYPGTLLIIEFRTDTIEYIEEDFSWD